MRRATFNWQCLFVFLAATSAFAVAKRNRAGEMIRSGAWRYHSDSDPCSGGTARSKRCEFTIASQLRRLDEQSSAKLSVSSTEIPHMGTVRVSFSSRLVTSAYDWIGIYCHDDERQPVDDKQYLDYVYVRDLAENATDIGPLANMRCSWQFRYFTYKGSNAYVRLAESDIVRMAKGKQEPLHVRAAATTKASEMRIMWVSAPVDSPTLEYGASANALSHRVRGSGTTYKATDMCESPATEVSATRFRDPGVMYNAVMTDLKPDSVYYYRINGGPNTPQSQIFKLKTPPAPGVQSRPASFFVYGDLGDASIHATGQDSAKRTLTTIQLMRRDMSDPTANYVAVMHDGDLSYAMGRTYLWDQFGALIEPVSTEIPYMIGVGNHEYGYTSGGDKDPSGAPDNGFHPPDGNYGGDSHGECGVPTNKRFIMPDNGNKVFWWSVEMGLVHHTMISSEHDFTPGSPMHAWLLKDLASVDRRRTPWLFLHLHRPIYTSEKYEADYKVSLLLRRHLEDVLGTYNVDAVFSGHYHAYELTCPVFAEKCRSEKLPNGLQRALAPVHIMVGSAGAAVDEVGYYDVPWRVDAQLEYGYGRVHVYNASHAQFEFVRNRDEIVASSTWIITTHDWNHTTNSTVPPETIQDRPTNITTPPGSTKSPAIGTPGSKTLGPPNAATPRQVTSPQNKRPCPKSAAPGIVFPFDADTTQRAPMFEFDTRQLREALRR